MVCRQGDRPGAAASCPLRSRRSPMASEGEVRAAIAKVRHNPTGASRNERDLVEQAAKQAGGLGNDARNALAGK